MAKTMAANTGTAIPFGILEMKSRAAAPTIPKAAIVSITIVGTYIY